MKKIVALFLTLLMLIPCLTTCGDTAPREIYEEIIGNVRVQLYSPTALRIEEAVDGAFCDGETIAVTNRSDWDGVKVKREEKDGEIRLVTDLYTVVLPAGATDASDVKVLDSAGKALWTAADAGTSNTVNLPDPGDTPTVWSFCDSPRVTVPENGFTSIIYDLNNGFTYTEDVTDHYLFVCDGDAFVLRDDYNRLVGSCDMLSVKALGLWFSHCHAYYDTELLALADDYRERGYPLDYMVVDTAWKQGGSIGYEINTGYFPDMAGFFDALHERNVAVSLNDHVRFFPQSVLEWDVIEWFNEQLTEKLEMGLDTWWYDRNWEYHLVSPFEGIHPDMLGQLLYQAIEEAHDAPSNDRTVVLSNYYSNLNGQLTLPAYIGTHRYGIQWTGDIYPEMLQSEIENMVQIGALTSTAFISSDIGGFSRIPTDELFIRWTQYGTLSPIMRYHNGFVDHSPWNYGELADKVGYGYIQMRYRLLPLFYTLAHENHTDGLPVARRLDFYYPQHAESRRNDQYLLGEDILVAPISGDRAISPSQLKTADGESGVRITYYNNAELSGDAAATEIVESFALDWRNSTPPADVNADCFSAVMEAVITVGDEDITLETVADEGVRLYVDGERIIDRWESPTYNPPIDREKVLEAGTVHELRVEYSNRSSLAYFDLCYRHVEVTELENVVDERDVFIPDGSWMDVFSGEVYTGPQTITVSHDLTTSPIFVRLGSLTALAYQADYASTADWQKMVLDVYPMEGSNDISALYEDDGATLDYMGGSYRETELKLATEDGVTTVTVGAAKGDYTTEWSEREWTLRIHSTDVTSVTVNGKAVDFTVIPQDADAYPFAVTGGSPDGDVVTVTFTAPIGKDCKIVIK